ncbi:MAG: hypothetical protein OFPI_00450 [Osedax symbiont Rs2]|nr:MAG: hypothetical protein OFPI_00450 [Osedax symbiont Rs2]
MINNRLKNLFWIFLEKIGLIVLSFIAFYFFAKYLSVDDYGIGVLAIVIVEFIGMFFSGLWSDPLVRRSTKVAESYSSVFWIGGLGVIILMPVFNLGILYFTNNRELALLTSIASIKVLAVVLARPFVAQLRRDKNFKLLAVRTLLGKVVGAVVGIVLAINGFGALAVVSQIVVMQVLELLVLIWGNSGLIRSRVELTLFIKLSREGIPIAVKDVLTGGLVKGTIIILGFTTSPTIIGYFAFANRLIDLPFNSIRNGVKSYVIPVMARRSEVDQNIGPLMSNLTFATAVFTLPIFIMISTVGPPYISLLFDGNWDSAIPIFQYIGFLACIKLFFLYHGIALVSIGKGKIGVWLEISNTIVTLVITFLLSPIYGLAGVVISLGINLIFDVIIKIYSLVGLIEYDIKKYFYDLLKVSLSGIIMLLVIIQNQSFFDTNIYISTFFTIITGFISYILSLIIFRFTFNRYIKLALEK